MYSASVGYTECRVKVIARRSALNNELEQTTHKFFSQLGIISALRIKFSG
ncbi:hypothetical protein SAMN02746065_108146 [Desulfocicer vacuolatum DSM 3385]|uniref:Uncharacterized protein n=1 Tax=Desulfocicer vacuolatum DSM 3385 TaxID=1121400 RepID=A0A1W2BJH6_9BACT|nr:hypothetical protein SAMN02746065_108146 [Desulfocicer vacuolatum DSM 3385]